MSALNLIRVFDGYLIVTFAISLVMRYRQYRELLDLVLSGPGRWPKLIQLAQQQKSAFLTWPMLVPVILTFTVMVLHMAASWFVWRSATVTPADLWAHPWMLLTVVGLALAMLALDYDAVFNVGRLDRQEIIKNLDKAEYWLRSWVGGAVRILTLGYVDPRRIVANEVRANLTWLSGEVGKMMWRWALQIAVRISFGLSLWLSWGFWLPA